MRHTVCQRGGQAVCKKKSDRMPTYDKEADVMPVIELVECERAS